MSDVNPQLLLIPLPLVVDVVAGKIRSASSMMQYDILFVTYGIGIWFIAYISCMNAGSTLSHIFFL